MGFTKRLITREGIISKFLENRNINDVIDYINKPDSLQLNNDTFVNDVYNCITNNQTGNLKVLLEKYIYNK